MRHADTPSTAFEGTRLIARGRLAEVALAAKQALDRSSNQLSPPAVWVFDDSNSEAIELDWRGDEDAFVRRLAGQWAATPKAPSGAAGAAGPGDAPTAVTSEGVPDAPRGPGRPRLGVVAREVTLLPRHWDWLAGQSGGASVALRKLVEAARRTSEASDRVKRARAVGYRFMSTMAGHETGFEEASRALFAGDRGAFEARTAHWSTDIRAHLLRLLADGLDGLDTPVAEAA